MDTIDDSFDFIFPTGLIDDQAAPLTMHLDFLETENLLRCRLAVGVYRDTILDRSYLDKGVFSFSLVEAGCLENVIADCIRREGPQGRAVSELHYDCDVIF